MPKPVLSDSLFNADDVATAILSEANLSVTNQDFAVSDITNKLTLETGWSAGGTITNKLFTFNGFVFCQIYCDKTSTPANNEKIAQINDSTYYPAYQVLTSTISYQGETALQLYLTTSGELKVEHPHDPGDTHFRIVSNFWYRYS